MTHPESTSESLLGEVGDQDSYAEVKHGKTVFISVFLLSLFTPYIVLRFQFSHDYALSSTQRLDYIFRNLKILVD